MNQIDVKRYTLAEIKYMAETGTLPKDLKDSVDEANRFYHAVNMSDYLTGLVTGASITMRALSVKEHTVTPERVAGWLRAVREEKHIQGSVFIAIAEMIVHAMVGKKNGGG